MNTHKATAPNVRRHMYDVLPVTLLDEFRMAIAMQCQARDGFWADMMQSWVENWKARKVLQALVTNHG
jgi:hypothetical protein